jgi:hypothetical protein
VAWVLKVVSGAMEETIEATRPGSTYVARL